MMHMWVSVKYLMTVQDNFRDRLRQRNKEASKRFRHRRRIRMETNRNQIKQLQETLVLLNDKVAQLQMENKYWKLQMDRLNQQRLEHLLHSIRHRV